MIYIDRLIGSMLRVSPMEPFDLGPEISTPDLLSSKIIRLTNFFRVRGPVSQGIHWFCRDNLIQSFFLMPPVVFSRSCIDGFPTVLRRFVLQKSAAFIAELTLHRLVASTPRGGSTCPIPGLILWIDEMFFK